GILGKLLMFREFKEPRLILGMILMFNVITAMPKDASKVEKFKELSVTVCMMARIQQADCDSDKGRIYDYEFISEASDSSMSCINELYLKSDHEQKYR
ncbi:hypothetical protein Tco_1350118, partial [Tanacetum coccineum]